jgi:hypothetical protein
VFEYVGDDQSHEVCQFSFDGVDMFIHSYFVSSTFCPEFLGFCTDGSHDGLRAESTGIGHECGGLRFMPVSSFLAMGGKLESPNAYQISMTGLKGRQAVHWTTITLEDAVDWFTRDWL